jgi:hypothetical protein
MRRIEAGRKPLSGRALVVLAALWLTALAAVTPPLALAVPDSPEGTAKLVSQVSLDGLTPPGEITAEVGPRLEREFPSPTAPPAFKGKKTVFLPIPMVGTAPNKGVDMGLLPVWLYFNQAGNIKYILAPSVDYNTDLGLILTARLFSYPNPDRKWYAIVERSLKVRQNYEFYFEDYRWQGGNHYLRVRGQFQDDPTAVFYGLGPESKKENQSNYNQREVYAEGYYGWNANDWRLLVSERMRYVTVQNVGIPRGSFVGDHFPGALGLAGSFDAAHGVAVMYDDRDFPDLPIRGRFAQIFAEVSFSPLSDYTFVRYGLEYRQYVPWPTDQFITACQFLWTEVSNSNIPFYEQPCVGGSDFRGYPDSRFIGRGKVQANLEERIRVLRMHVFDVDFDVEVAPFFAVGQVFDETAKAFSDLRPIGGVGFRAVVRPQVVGKVDIGYGSEGMNIFVGLNYPY